MENLYELSNPVALAGVDTSQVRWLSANEYDTFRDHIELCHGRAFPPEKWAAMLADGTVYCGIFADGRMVARAAVEKLTADIWEVSDVRTAHEYRRRGYSKAVCAFAARHILSHGMRATIRTEEDNLPMQGVIAALGFDRILEEPV